jgi:hypothetical protein
LRARQGEYDAYDAARGIPPGADCLPRGNCASAWLWCARAARAKSAHFSAASILSARARK